MKTNTLTFLNKNCMEAIDPKTFLKTQPFPWINAQGMLTDTGYQQLLDNLLPPDRLNASFGKARKYQQTTHDRHLLYYQKGMPLPTPWQTFIDELCSDQYRNFARRLVGGCPIRFQFCWHYTPTGCSISPHCDSRSKVGTHIFYLNTPDNWKTEWGGQTLVLDDNQQFNEESNPSFDDFHKIHSTDILHNHSLIFGRNKHSWHGMKPLRSPKGALRKVFIVTYERQKTGLKGLVRRVKRKLQNKPAISEKETMLY